MKKRPNLVLREPVKLYENKREVPTKFAKTEKVEKKESELPKMEKVVEKREVSKPQTRESVKDKMPPRIGQIWDYFCRKAKADGEIKRSFNLTRSEVMKEAGIGSTNTYRDALKRFQDMDLLEIELRPGVNSGSIFTLTEKGIEQID